MLRAARVRLACGRPQLCWQQSEKSGSDEAIWVPVLLIAVEVIMCRVERFESRRDGEWRAVCAGCAVLCYDGMEWMGPIYANSCIRQTDTHYSSSSSSSSSSMGLYGTALSHPTPISVRHESNTWPTQPLNANMDDARSDRDRRLTV